MHCCKNNLILKADVHFVIHILQSILYVCPMYTQIAYQCYKYYSLCVTDVYKLAIKIVYFYIEL